VGAWCLHLQLAGNISRLVPWFTSRNRHIWSCSFRNESVSIFWSEGLGSLTLWDFHRSISFHSPIPGVVSGKPEEYVPKWEGFSVNFRLMTLLPSNGEQPPTFCTTSLWFYCLSYFWLPNSIRSTWRLVSSTFCFWDLRSLSIDRACYGWSLIIQLLFFASRLCFFVPSPRCGNFTNMSTIQGKRSTLITIYHDTDWRCVSCPSIILIRRAVRMGQHVWLLLATIVTEILVITKWSKGLFPEPLPSKVKWGWIITASALILYPIQRVSRPHTWKLC